MSTEHSSPRRSSCPLLLVALVVSIALGCRTEPLKISRTRVSTNNGHTYRYMVEKVAGWDVYVSDTVWLDRPRLTRDVLSELQISLIDITRALPLHVIPQLRSIPIYITNTRSMTVQVHRTREQLREDGEDEEKVGSIDISNPERLLRYPKHQPWWLLQAFSHLFEMNFLDTLEIAELQHRYTEAMKENKYQFVAGPYGFGAAPASAGYRYYFAATSAAFWGRSGYYPYDREELRDYDPFMLEFVERVWTRKRD